MNDVDWTDLENQLATGTHRLSVWCHAGGPAGHARCNHPANRRRTDGCACSCHRPATRSDLARFFDGSRWYRPGLGGASS
jgi:hypothetical protein